MWRSVQRFIQSRPALKAPYTVLSKTAKRTLRCLDRRTLSEPAFEQALGEIGVVPGATVMIHCSIDEVMRRVPTTNAVKLIGLLQKLLTPEGTLLVPNSPFSGLEADWVHANDRFDVRRTASRVGLYTEVFRRMPGVIRSMQPTHAVAGWGKNASEILSTHHLGGAFGEKSPFCRLREFGGLVIGIGAPMGKFFTIMHAVEELHPRTRKLLFEEEPYHVTIVNGAQTFEYTSHALRAGVRRNFQDMEDGAIAAGALRVVRRGGLRFDSAEAKSLIEVGLELIEKGVYSPG